MIGHRKEHKYSAILWNCISCPPWGICSQARDCRAFPKLHGHSDFPGFELLSLDRGGSEGKEQMRHLRPNTASVPGEATPAASSVVRFFLATFSERNSGMHLFSCVWMQNLVQKFRFLDCV